MEWAGVCFLQIKLAFRHADNEIIFQACCLGRGDIVALEDLAQIGEILPVLLAQRRNPSAGSSGFFRVEQFRSIHVHPSYIQK